MDEALAKLLDHIDASVQSLTAGVNGLITRVALLDANAVRIEDKVMSELANTSAKCQAGITNLKDDLIELRTETKARSDKMTDRLFEIFLKCLPWIAAGLFVWLQTKTGGRP